MALVGLAMVVVLGVLGFARMVRHVLHEGSGRTHADAGSRLEEVIVEEGSAGDKLVVIDIEGVIYGGAKLGGSAPDLVESVREQLKRAEKDEAVKGILLRIDSPGGEVLAADDIYRQLENFQERTGKPVVASMGSVAASGGYYVAAPCRWIVANALTITGSIGVIMHGYNYRGLMDKVGVQPEVYKSGRFKDMMSGEKRPEEILPEEKEMVQSLINETFERFKTVVAEGRRKTQSQRGSEGRTLTTEWEKFADGRVFSGQQAHAWGFVDELGDFRTAVKRAEALAKIEDARLIRYEEPFELGNLLRLFAKSDARGLKLDLGLDFPPIRTGRLYYLFLPGAR